MGIFDRYTQKNTGDGSRSFADAQDDTGNGVTAGALFEAKMAADAMRQPIGRDEIIKAMDTLRRYKAGKANLDRRIVENEQWWKLRHWDYMEQQGTTDLKTKSSWLINVLLSKHADAMDSFPEPNCLARASDDKEEARKLSAIIPAVLEQNDFEKAYADAWWDKLKHGTGMYSVLWDASALNGLGDIAVKQVDVLNLFWEPGVTDIQKSRNVFYVHLADKDVLEELYPDQLMDKLKGKDFTPARYLYDDNVDTTNKVSVVDWYYKKRGKLHYCKFVNDIVLYATENDASPVDGMDGMSGTPSNTGAEMDGMQYGQMPQTMAERGLYDHGKYPFVPDVMFPEKGTPCGYGFVDICKDPQRQIDLMNNAMVANCVAQSTPRWLVRGDGGINEEEYADWTKPFVHVQGNIDEAAMRAISVNPFNSNYIAVLQNKIMELKETSGNRDVNNGGAASGVTAASAIAAMQEQSGKLSRDEIKNTYRCYRQIVYLMIELVRQFYTAPREFRIMGQNGEPDYISYTNAGITPVPQTDIAGNDMGIRCPVFDIEVSAQKQSAYNKMSQNELALQFYGQQFFNPQNATQTLMCLDMMDFRGRTELMDKIKEQGQMNDLFMKFQTMLQANPQLGMLLMQAPDMPMQPNGVQQPQGAAEPGKLSDGEQTGNHYVDKARQQAQDATAPRQ